MITCGTQIVSGSTGGGGASAPAGTGVVTVSGGAFVDPVASAATTRATLDAQQDVLTTRGDLVRAGVSGVAERLPLGTATHVLTSDGTDAAWAAPAGGAPSGAAGGDLGGSYPAPTVTDLTIASEARGDLLRRGASAWSRLAIGTSGKVLTSDGTDPVWSAAAGASLSAANVFTDKQTFRFESGNYAQARICAAVRHRCSIVGQNFGAALAFESEQVGSSAEELGVVRARRFDDQRWCELLPGRSNGTPPTAGFRCRSTGAVDAIYGVEVIVAASGGSPTVRPCTATLTTPDVDLTLTGLGAGGVVLPNARPLVDTVANITALTRPAGTMGFATDASGGAKPCWSTGSGWILASGSALT